MKFYTKTHQDYCGIDLHAKLEGWVDERNPAFPDDSWVY